MEERTDLSTRQDTHPASFLSRWSAIPKTSIPSSMTEQNVLHLKGWLVPSQQHLHGDAFEEQHPALCFVLNNDQHENTRCCDGDTTMRFVSNGISIICISHGCTECNRNKPLIDNHHWLVSGTRRHPRGRDQRLGWMRLVQNEGEEVLDRHKNRTSRVKDILVETSSLHVDTTTKRFGWSHLHTWTCCH